MNVNETDRVSDAVEVETVPVIDAQPFRMIDPYGRPFIQPVLLECGLLIEEFVLIRDENDELKTRRSSYLFDMAGGVPVESPEQHSPRWLVAASVRNLLEFLRLPYISDDQKAEAARLCFVWGHAIPTACFQVMMDRTGTAPDEQAPGYRKLTYHRVEKRTVVRDLTPPERLAAMFGAKLPTEAERTSVEKQYVPEEHPAYDLQQYSPRRLYSQQLLGARAILHAKRLGVFYDMRVGKTQTGITAARAALAAGEADYLIVVAPKGNLYDPWVPELQRNGFDVAVLDGDEDEDEFAISHAPYWEAPYHERSEGNRPLAILVNYERIRLRWTTLIEYLDLRRAFIIGDETSAIKNPGAARSKAMHRLCATAAYVVLLNGTPMEQGPQDLWSQLRCLDPHGTVIGNEFFAFAKRFLVEVSPGKWRVSGEPSVRRAFDVMLSTLSIRYIRGEADQFAGKDKTFRYIAIKPTQPMVDQAKNIANGFIKTLTEDGLTAQEISSCVLAVYGFLRELCCGYDKYKDEDEGEYRRVRHSVDPKLLWVRAFLESNPTEPLVLYTNFNEQEQAAKEMLDSMGIKWTATKPKCRVVYKTRVVDELPASVANWLCDRLNTAENPQRVRFSKTYKTALVGGQTQELLKVPGWLEWDDEVIRLLEGRFTGYTERVKTYHEQMFSAQERAAQVAAFNRGDSHVFILKVKQGRGISLNRTEAVGNDIGTYPTIIFLSPPWSLGDWEQAQDRCVGVDPKTGKNINTIIYALCIAKSIEEKIMTALRHKKEVATELMDDAKREGFGSFISGLVDSMTEAARNGDKDGIFDTDEMQARATVGVPPASKLTESFVLNRLIEKHGKSYSFKSKPDALRWLQSEPLQAVVFSEDGVVLNPHMAVREAAFRLLERTPEWKDKQSVFTKTTTESA